MRHRYIQSTLARVGIFVLTFSSLFSYSPTVAFATNNGTPWEIKNVGNQQPNPVLQGYSAIFDASVKTNITGYYAVSDVKDEEGIDFVSSTCAYIVGGNTQNISFKIQVSSNKDPGTHHFDVEGKKYSTTSCTDQGSHTNKYDGAKLVVISDPDTDHDGIRDSKDNCKFVKNFSQLDSDTDGVGDVCDADDDNDGVADTSDNCSLTPNTNQANNDGDNLGDVCDSDDDNDGVLDTVDNCVFTANQDQTDADEDGIGDVCDQCVATNEVEVCENQLDDNCNGTVDEGCEVVVPKGSIEITKYECTATTTVLRANNGVGGVVPESCAPQQGAKFGYVHGTQTDANGPYPELDAALTAGGTTNASGVLLISDLPATGRYLIAETDSSTNKLPAGDVLGLYCEGDGDTSATNDNQELTFVHSDSVSKCVAYNKIIVPPEPECNPNATQTIISDTTDIVNGEGNAVLTWVHPLWVSILGSNWVWNEAKVTDPTAEQTNIFSKSFTIVGAVKAASLEIASDNGYKVEINGVVVQDNLAIEKNFLSTATLDVKDKLHTGTNNLQITVKNLGLTDSTPESNPAGLIYKLIIDRDECGTTPPPVKTSGDVTMCKKDLGGQSLPGWELMLKGEVVRSIQVRSDGSDYVAASIPAGTYLIKATGQYTYRPGTIGAEYSDAAYSLRAATDAVYGGPFAPWVRVNDFPAPHTGWLGVTMNNSFTDWGSVYNGSHIYQFVTTTAAAGDFAFKILDDNYSDNSGFVTVEIIKVYSGVTGENGCVTFKDVPFGGYVTDEVMKEHWENVSGLGEITVSGPTLTIDIVNKYDPPQYKVHIYKYIDGEPAVSENTGGVSFPMFTTFNAANLGSYANVPFTLKVGGWSAGDSDYEASTAPMDIGSTYSAWEDTSTSLVGASCESGNVKYALAGYSSGATLTEAEAAASVTEVPVFTSLNSDKYLIVRNVLCREVPTQTLKVHIQKYIDGQLATVNLAGEYQFPMSATWQTANLNSGESTTGNYLLGNGHGGSVEPYGADTAEMSAPASYETHEVTGGDTKVLATDQDCVQGKYRLLGYKTSATSFADAATQPTSTSASFTELTSDRYVLVLNEKCVINNHEDDGEKDGEDKEKKLPVVFGGGAGLLIPEPPILGKPPATSKFFPNSNSVIEVTFDVQNAFMMQISEDKNFTSMGWQPFATTTSLILSGSNQDKKFYIKFRGVNGGETRTVELTAGSTGIVLGVKITRLDELVAKLKFGDRSEEVKEMQTALKELGYFSKWFKPTSWYGPMTKAAVSKYLSNKK